jgi:hypothetical protein
MGCRGTKRERPAGSSKEMQCRKNMVIKPGLIGNGRKTFFGGSAILSFAKNCALQLLSLADGKIVIEDGQAPNCAGQR